MNQVSELPFSKYQQQNLPPLINIKLEFSRIAPSHYQSSPTLKHHNLVIVINNNDIQTLTSTSSETQLKKKLVTEKEFVKKTTYYAHNIQNKFDHISLTFSSS